MNGLHSPEKFPLLSCCVFLLLLFLIFVVNSESCLDLHWSCGALAVSYAVTLKFVNLIPPPPHFIYENL